MAATERPPYICPSARPVLSSWFLVLSSEFLVLGSAVLRFCGSAVSSPGGIYDSKHTTDPARRAHPHRCARDRARADRPLETGCRGAERWRPGGHAHLRAEPAGRHARRPRAGGCDRYDRAPDRPPPQPRDRDQRQRDGGYWGNRTGGADPGCLGPGALPDARPWPPAGVLRADHDRGARHRHRPRARHRPAAAGARSAGDLLVAARRAVR